MGKSIRFSLQASFVAMLFLVAIVNSSVYARDNDGVTELMMAAESGDLDRVNALIGGHADVKAKDKNGGTALMRAATSGNADCVKALIGAGADVNAQMNFGFTALEMAVYGGGNSQRSRPNFMLKTKEDTVGIAAGAGDVDCVKALLAAGARVNAKDWLDSTALMWAAARGKTDSVKALIDSGADVNATMKLGLSALQLAVCGARTYQDSSLGVGFSITTLIGQSNLRSKTSSGGIPAAAGNVDCVRALLAGGARVNGKDDIGCTALISAAASGKTDCVKALLEGGADVNAKADEGKTALELAVYGQGQWIHSDRSKNHVRTVFTSAGSVDCIAALMAAGADVNAKDKDGTTVLMRAAVGGNSDFVQALIAAHADVNGKDRSGHTALDLTRSQEVMGILQAAGGTK